MQQSTNLSTRGRPCQPRRPVRRRAVPASRGNQTMPLKRIPPPPPPPPPPAESRGQDPRPDTDGAAHRRPPPAQGRPASVARRFPGSPSQHTPAARRIAVCTPVRRNILLSRPQQHISACRDVRSTTQRAPVPPTGLIRILVATRINAVTGQQATQIRITAQYYSRDSDARHG